MLHLVPFPPRLTANPSARRLQRTLRVCDGIAYGWRESAGIVQCELHLQPDAHAEGASQCGDLALDVLSLRGCRCAVHVPMLEGKQVSGTMLRLGEQGPWTLLNVRESETAHG